MRKFIFGLIILIAFTSCEMSSLPNTYRLKYDTEDKSFEVIFSGRYNSFIYYFKNDSNLYNLIIEDTLSNRLYRFNSNFPIDVTYSDIPINQNN